MEQTEFVDIGQKHQGGGWRHLNNILPAGLRRDTQGNHWKRKRCVIWTGYMLLMWPLGNNQE